MIMSQYSFVFLNCFSCICDFISFSVIYSIFYNLTLNLTIMIINVPAATCVMSQHLDIVFLHFCDFITHNCKFMFWSMTLYLTM